MNKSFNAILICIAILTGCSTTPDRSPLPVELISKVSIPGIPAARFWADEWPRFSIQRLNSFSDAELKKRSSATYNVPHNYLAISGGGANGAFGAGLLAGWTASGTRPEFTMVTGVSTGALTAPFAFLGADYDAKLKTIYTTTWTKDVALERNLIAALFGDSLADTKPLKQLIRHYMTPEVIKAIAIEHKKGRRLFLGTVNLDAARSVIWNIGAIAVSDYPEKVSLIHDIMRASAAIPVAFPPVMIPVEVDGKQYDEMHVDGSVGAQVFVYPAAVNWKKLTKRLKVKGRPQVFVIRNAFIEPDYNGVNRSVLPIASRSIDALLRASGTGDLYQIYALCKRDGNDFNLAYIPTDFTDKPSEGFDPVYMSKLYQRGYDMAYQGYPWEIGPPGFVRVIEAESAEK
ncbi:MAG: patatin [Methyloprofundus sp.]|nr:patatin [Methyloprofundus sp.]